MISRTRLIITALFACHLFLHPALLTSQLRMTAQGQDPTQSEPGPIQAGTMSPGNPAAGQSPNSPAGTSTETQTSSRSDSPTKADRSANSSPTAASPPIDIKAITDDHKEDTETEQIIQQEIQETAVGSEQEFGPPRPGTNTVLGHDEVLIRGDQQEKNQDVYKARGHVEIRFRQYILHSDEATYDSTSGRVTATGHVVFDGGPHNEHIESTHGTYDVSRDTGTFYDATGSTGVRVKNKMMFLTSSTPFFFAGKVIEKLGPDQYRVNHGYVTSCQLKKPNWQLNSETANIDLGDEARLHHSTLRIRGFPLSNT